MARFEVFRAESGTMLLDVQADHLAALESRVVVPMIPAWTAGRPMRDLNPMLSINGEQYVLMTQLLAAVPRSALTDPVDNLDRHWDEIMRALDMLFTGF